MYSHNIRGRSSTSLRDLKAANLPFGFQFLGSSYMRRNSQGSGLTWLLPVLLLLVSAMDSIRASAQPAPPASSRITINLSQGVPNYCWKCSRDRSECGLATKAIGGTRTMRIPQHSRNPAMSTTAVPAADAGPSCGSTISTPDWQQVGIPTDANIWRTFINQSAGGGQGSVCGQNNWYRLHFKVGPTYANSKILIEFEGAHTSGQVYINGTLLPASAPSQPTPRLRTLWASFPSLYEPDTPLHQGGWAPRTMCSR